MPEHKPKTAEDNLLDFLVALRFEDIPPSAVDAVLALVLDHFTCALVGLEMPWTKTLRKVVARAAYEGAEGSAVIYGDSRPVPAETAALVNGTAAHGLDFDDLHFGTMSHPGCVVVPAAFAAASAAGADGRALVAAAVVGYEPMLRTGLAAGLRYGEIGFHATGVLGPVGAAAAAARLLQGDRGSRLADAVWLAASLGSGIKAFNEYGPGMVKRLHAGRAAESGILAARLAAAGYEGPRQALSARFGLARVLALGGDADVLALARDLGRPYLVEEVYIKPYAACGALHGAVQAAEQVAESRPGLQPEDVREVVVGTSPRVLAQNSNPEPADVMAAQYSAEVAVAIALLGGAGDPHRFVDVTLDPDDPARRLARRVRLEVDERARATYPDPNEGEVAIVEVDGRSLARRGSSTPSGSRGWSVARRKFEAVTAGRLDPDAQRRLLDAVQDLAEGGPVAACTDALVRVA